MLVQYKEAKTIPEFIDACRIRTEVFIKEQGFEPGWEPDDDDKKARYFLAIVAGRAVATARFREMSKGEIKIERMAALKEYRGKGISKGLFEFMMKRIKKLKPKAIWLRSQLHAQAFYEKCGFKAVKAPFDLFGVQHVEMECDFKKHF